VFAGLNRLLVAALLAGAIFAAPSVALADCGGGPSAQHVYSECVPGGSGGKATKPTIDSKQGGSIIPSSTATAIGKAGKDRRTLSAFVRGAGRRTLPAPTPSSGSEPEPSALGSAFDLGSGPIALLAALAGTALLLLGGSGLRLWRSRHGA
jgi:hypothetical protein